MGATWFAVGLVTGVFFSAAVRTWVHSKVGGVIVFPVSALKRFLSTASVEENAAVTKLLLSCGAMKGHDGEVLE